MPTITPGNLSLASAQTANMNAAAYNRANPGMTQIDGGIGVGSSGSYNPSTVQTPAPASSPEMNAANSISTSPNATVATGTAIGTPRAGVVSPIVATTNVVSKKRPIVGKAVTTPTLTGKPVSTPVPTINSTTPASPLAPITPIAQRTGTSDQFPIGTFPTKAVKPIAPTTPVNPATDLYTTATPDQKSNADAYIQRLDPNNQLPATEQQRIKNAVLSGNLSEVQKIADEYGVKYQEEQQLSDAYKLTRDTTLKNEFDQNQTDQKIAQTKQEYDTAIQEQKNKIESQANNMAVLQDTTGRLQSRNMVNAINQQMTEQQTILNNLGQNQKWASEDIINTAKYNHDILANQYNDKIASYDANVLDQLKVLQNTGMAKTVDGLKAAQSLVDEALNKKTQAGYFYAQTLKDATERMKLQVAERTPDDAQSALANDGKMHNKNGDIIFGKNGQPLVYSPQKKFKSTATDSKGNLIAVYEDGTTSVISEGRVASQDELQNYAKMVQQYGVGAMNNLPDHIKSQVMGYLGQNGMSPVKESDWGVVRYEYDENTGTNVPVMGWINKTNQTINGGGGGGSFGNPTTGVPGVKSAADFTKSKEGFQNKAYWDVNGWAVGYGQHSINGVPVKQGDTVDETTATNDLNNRINNAKFNSLIKVPLSESQKAGLYSLEHNVGGGVWGFTNGKKIIDQMNALNFKGASDTLANSGIGTTEAANHTVLPGLVTRRKEEAQLLLDNGKPQQSTAPTTPTSQNPLGLAIEGVKDFFGNLMHPNQTQTTPAQTYIPSQKSILEGYGKQAAAGTLAQKDRIAIAHNLGIKPDQLDNMYNDYIGSKSTAPLSNAAKAAVDSKSITGSPTQQEDIINELQNKGIIGTGKGNKSLYLANKDQKTEFGNLINGYDAFRRAQDIIKKYEDNGKLDSMLGFYDSWVERKKNNLVTIDSDYNKDFATLDNIFGKELSQYMSKISGATVGDKEVDRLMKQVPNLDMNESQFKAAMQEYNSAFNNANSKFITDYGFDSMDTARQVLLGKQNQTTSPTPAQPTLTTQGQTQTQTYISPSGKSYSF